MMISNNGQYCQKLSMGVIPKLSNRMIIPAVIRINPIHKGGLVTFSWYLIFPTLQVEFAWDDARRHFRNSHHLDMRLHAGHSIFGERQDLTAKRQMDRTIGCPDFPRTPGFALFILTQGAALINLAAQNRKSVLP
jgi:hypothetical protein